MFPFHDMAGMWIVQQERTQERRRTRNSLLFASQWKLTVFGGSPFLLLFLPEFSHRQGSNYQTQWFKSSANSSLRCGWLPNLLCCSNRSREGISRYFVFHAKMFCSPFTRHVFVYASIFGIITVIMPFPFLFPRCVCLNLFNHRTLIWCWESSKNHEGVRSIRDAVKSQDGRRFAIAAARNWALKCKLLMELNAAGAADDFLTKWIDEKESL